MSNKHRKTLDAIFTEPTLSNIAWSDIESLLLAVGAQKFEGNGSRVRFLLNDVKATFQRDVITFQGTTVAEIKQAFHDSVEDYLDFCAQLGHEPEKPFTGKFMVRIPPELHSRIYSSARIAGKSMNAWVIEQLKQSTAYVH